ncbi:EAL domain-containing protein [Seleniivibrio woodruffii]|uniref:EAL domain-containing protein n=1 Tax=Seleniivibrio woodruffii TaxID=1078050 RepID=UPI0026EA0EC4|nr:EAL domain-containing protein [Seleniivibrio woodruffii]
MSCAKCTEVPSVPQGAKGIYISASHEYILEKISSILANESFSTTKHGAYIHFVTDCFSDVISRCAASGELTELEKQNISILPLGVDEILDFGKASAAKSLDSWNTLILSKDLIWILENGSFTVHFQPIIDASTMTIYGYECLSRGVLPDTSMMSPAKMFDAAKKTGMLFNLDRQCRETAIKTSAVKNINKNIFINFLPTSIYNPEFCLKDTVKWAHQLEFDPSTIVFEVVETEKVDSAAHLQNILRFYKEKGFRTAMDDVGSGYSSLNMFASLSPDIIKIDMELVRDVHKNIMKQSVSRALVSMAKEAGCKVLAEGIENVDEFEWFKVLGIDYAQGYYFGKPSAEPLRQL